MNLLPLNPSTEGPKMRSRFVLAVVLFLLLQQTSFADEITLTVSETAGLRRFGYPVHAKLTLPRDVGDTDRFRLLLVKKPVAAQFRVLPGDKKKVALDFNVNQAPFEKKTYTIEYGPKVETGPEPKKGMT